MPPRCTADEPAEPAIVVPFPYAAEPALPADSGALPFPQVDIFGKPIDQPRETDAAASQAAYEDRLADAVRRSFAEGLARGTEEGRAAERAVLADAQSAETAHRASELSRAVLQFAAARDSYLQRIETEVVRLALGLAARILRREAQSDPLLLLGAVRAALGQLAAGTRARLRVPAEHAALWTEAVALLPARALKPEIIADPALLFGDCALETELGSADLALAAQLSEIESRFFPDAPRPASHPDSQTQSVDADDPVADGEYVDMELS